jgi:hypothetical protein
LAATAAILDFLYALSRERLKLPSAAGRLQLPCPIGIDIPPGEQLDPPAPLLAAVHAADHFL